MVDNENLFMKKGLLAEISIKRDLSVKLSISVRLTAVLRLFTAFEATTTHTRDGRVGSKTEHLARDFVFSGSAFSIDISVELGGDTGVNASVCPSKLLLQQPCCFGLYKVD